MCVFGVCFKKMERISSAVVEGLMVWALKLEGFRLGSKLFRV